MVRIAVMDAFLFFMDKIIIADNEKTSDENIAPYLTYEGGVSLQPRRLIHRLIFGSLHRLLGKLEK